MPFGDRPKKLLSAKAIDGGNWCRRIILVAIGSYQDNISTDGIWLLQTNALQLLLVHVNASQRYDWDQNMDDSAKETKLLL